MWKLEFRKFEYVKFSITENLNAWSYEFAQIWPCKTVKCVKKLNVWKVYTKKSLFCENFIMKSMNVWKLEYVKTILYKSF